jgi:hypothetical protein
MPYATINKPNLQFDTKLYTGTGATNSVTGIGFQPDFTWIKNRSGTDWHRLTDAVRGATKELYSNATNAEATLAQSLQTFNADGFTLGTQAEVNRNGDNFASWNWKANGAGVANTAGTISSTVSANTTSGFSIVTYTGNGTSGATVGHGLGSVPKMIIVKNRNSTNQWLVYHVSNGATKYMILETSGAVGTASTLWNDTTPTTSLFTVGSSSSVNGSALTYVAYCFAEIKGFSKFGTYTGNGSANGTFVYTGFKPAFVMIKYTGSDEGWVIIDDTRNTYNPESLYLYANLSQAEGTETGGLDFLSNGFKIRNSFGYTNTSSGNYIYMAFAEQPLVGTNNIPCTAR